MPPAVSKPNGDGQYWRYNRQSQLSGMPGSRFDNESGACWNQNQLPPNNNWNTNYSRKPVQCWQCNAFGYVSRWCPLSRQNYNSVPACSNTEDSELSHLNSSAPILSNNAIETDASCQNSYLAGKVFGRKSYAFIDSVSEVTVVPQRLLPNSIALQPSSRHLRAAS